MLSFIFYFAYNIAAIMAVDVLYALVIMFAKAYGLVFLIPASFAFFLFLFFTPRKWIFIAQSFLWPYVWATILVLMFPVTISWWILDVFAGITWSIMILIAAGCEIAYRYQ